MYYDGGKATLGSVPLKSAPLASFVAGVRTDAMGIESHRVRINYRGDGHINKAIVSPIRRKHTEPASSELLTYSEWPIKASH